MPECTTCARAPYNKDSHVCKNCFGYTPLGKPIYNHWTKKMHTNADRIRAMSDGKLAEFLTHTVADGCPPDMDWACQKDADGWEGCDKCWGRWLAQPAPEEE